jgi:hypothetical protein
VASGFKQVATALTQSVSFTHSLPMGVTLPEGNRHAPDECGKKVAAVQVSGKTQASFAFTSQGLVQNESGASGKFWV